METWVASLSEKTGRSLDEWITFIKNEGPKDEPATRTWLKDTLKLGTNTAWWLAERAFARDPSQLDDTPEGYTALAPKYHADQYAGKKEGLRPIFDRVYAFGRKLGKDVKVCPCKTIIPFYREHVFAQAKPSTKTRLDLGLCLIPLLKAGTSIPERLIDTGGFAKKDRITHRIPLANPDDFDDFAQKWMRKAYELDGGE